MTNCLVFLRSETVPSIYVIMYLYFTLKDEGGGGGINVVSINEMS